MKLWLFLGIMAALLAGRASAHFIWVELPPTKSDTAYLRFAEEPGEATDVDLQAKAAPIAIKTKVGVALAFTPATEALEAKVSPETALIGGSLEYGVLDREKQGRGKFLLLYHAKAARSAAEAGTRLGLPVEVTAKVEDGKLLIEVTKDGAPAAEAELNVHVPGSDAQELKTDSAGKAQVALVGVGEVGVRAMVAEARSGSFKDGAYTLARHYSTLTFWHGAVPAAATRATTKGPQTYPLSAAHSLALFKVQHAQASFVYGAIHSLEGSFGFDAESGELSEIQAKGAMSDFDTFNSDRDEVLKGEDVLNTTKFPEVSFKSTAIKKTGERVYEVTGDIHLLSVSKSITFEARWIGCGEGGHGGTFCGFEAELDLNTGDYGLKDFGSAVSQNVHITVNLEGKLPRAEKPVARTTAPVEPAAATQ